MSPRVDPHTISERKLSSKYQLFDRSRLKLKPIHEREHELKIDRWLDLEDDTPDFEHDDLSTVAKRLHMAKAKGKARV